MRRAWVFLLILAPGAFAFQEDAVKFHGHKSTNDGGATVPRVLFSSAPSASEGGVKISTNIIFSTFSFSGADFKIGDSFYVVCIATYVAVTQTKTLWTVYQPEQGAATDMGTTGSNSAGNWISNTWIKKVSNTKIQYAYSRLHPTTVGGFIDYVGDTSTGTIKLGCMSSSASGATGISMDVFYNPAP